MSYIRRSGVVWCDQGGELVAAGDPRRSGRYVVYLVGRHRRYPATTGGAAASCNR